MKTQARLIILYRIILGIIFLVLLIVLFTLQIIKGERYKEIAERNYVRIRRINAARGVIYDEKLNPIAVNNPSINLYFRPFLIKDKEKMADFVANNLPVEKKTVEKLIHDNRFRSFNEILIYENIDYNKMVTISENLNYYPELFFKVEMHYIASRF